MTYYSGWEQTPRNAPRRRNPDPRDNHFSVDYSRIGFFSNDHSSVNLFNDGHFSTGLLKSPWRKQPKRKAPQFYRFHLVFTQDMGLTRGP